MDLSSLATHAQRLSARLSENIAERSKDLALDPESLANPSNVLHKKLPILAHAQGLLGNTLPSYWDRLGEISSAEGELETKRLLGSRSEPDRVDGLKRVTAMMCRSRPVLSFFPFVTNCLHPSTSTTSNGSYQATVSHSFTIRHLVSIYILQHAHLSPDLALLSVNAWQKDLSDSNPIIRSLALKTLAGMGLESVLPLVMVTMDRLANDSNWLVKQTVAEALITVHNMDPETYGSKLIEGPLARLLKDRSPLVAGAVLMSWEAICPERWDLLHKRFRPLCWILPDADENGQHVIMRVLTRYVRIHFTNPGRLISSNNIDPDLKLFLDSVTSLFKSRNSSVLIAATNVFLFLAPYDRLHSIVPDLIRLVEEKSTEAQHEILLVILHHIYQIIKLTGSTARSSNDSGQQPKPHLFSDHFHHFVISSNDSQPVKMIKLKILSSFISVHGDRSIQLKILSELKFYSKDLHIKFAKKVIRTIGEMVAMTTGKMQIEALNVLIGLVKSGHSSQVCESIEMLRALLSSDSHTVHALLPNLQKSLNEELVTFLVHNKIQDDNTRANLYRLISEIDFRSKKQNTNFLQFYKYSISNFIKEGIQTKFQILSLVSKSLSMVFIRSQEQDQDHESMINAVLFDDKRIYQLGFEHLMRLARYDNNFVIRDRARFLQGLFMSTRAFNLVEEKDSAGFVEGNTGQNEGIELLDEHTAFTRGHQVLPSNSIPSSSPSNQDSSSTKKIHLNELQKILFLDCLPDSIHLKNPLPKPDFEASSLFRVFGFNNHEKVIKNLTPWKYLDWNTIPPWSNLPSDARLRDPDDEFEPQGSSLSSATQFPAGNFNKTSSSSSYRPSKERVVLIPTDEDESQNKTANKPGHRNLEDFLQSSDDDDEEEDEEMEESSNGSESEDDSSEAEGQE